MRSYLEKTHHKKTNSGKSTPALQNVRPWVQTPVPGKKKERKTIKNRTATLLVAIYPKEMNSVWQSGICDPTFIEVLFTVAKVRNPPTFLSPDKWIKRM
jgi:hypothetical protein